MSDLTTELREIISKWLNEHEGIPLNSTGYEEDDTIAQIKAAVLTRLLSKDFTESLDAILHLNGCQQRTAGHNEALDKKELDMDDMERLEKLTLDEVQSLLKKELS